MPKEAGGSGVDIMFTVRVRVKIRFLFFHFDLDPRNSIVPYMLGYNDGPIRVTRRVYSSIVIKGIKMDRLMGKGRMETESHYYRDFAFFDGELKLPGILKKLSRINAVFTTDFNNQAAGVTWYNSANGPEQGCVVDGRMSPQEERLEMAPYLWALLVGPQGGWVNVMRIHTESVSSHMKLVYLDDHAYRDSKEPAMNGAWASTGFHFDRLDKLQEKVTWRSYVFSVPSGFQVPDMSELVEMVLHPLKASANRTWEEAM